MVYFSYLYFEEIQDYIYRLDNDNNDENNIMIQKIFLTSHLKTVISQKKACDKKVDIKCQAYQYVEVPKFLIIPRINHSIHEEPLASFRSLSFFIKSFNVAIFLTIITFSLRIAYFFIIIWVQRVLLVSIVIIFVLSWFLQRIILYCFP